MANERISKKVCQAPNYKLVLKILIGIAIIVFAGYEFSDLLEFFLYESTATRLSTIPLRGSTLTNTISLTFCNPLWLNVSRYKQGISKNALDYAKSFMNLTSLSVQELTVRIAEETLNYEGMEEFLASLNKSNNSIVTAKEVREFLNSVANHQQDYRLKLHEMALQLKQIGYVFTGEQYCEKLRFIPSGNEYYHNVQSAKGEMVAELVVDFSDSDYSSINGSLSLNNFDYKTSISRGKTDIAFKKNIYSTTWLSVSIEKYVSLYKCDAAEELYIPWPGLGSVICNDYCRLWNNNCSAVEFYYGVHYKNYMRLENKQMCTALEWDDNYHRQHYENETQKCMHANKCESRKFCEEWEFTLTKTASYERLLQVEGDFARGANRRNIGVHAIVFDFSAPMLMYSEIQIMTILGFIRDNGYLLGLFFGFSATSISRWLFFCFSKIFRRKKAENLQQNGENV